MLLGTDFGIPLSQLPKRFVTFLGGTKPKDIWIILQIVLANWQAKNRCCIDSSWSQKQHFWFPCQFLFTKLSQKPHKILIFSGTFIFQINLCIKFGWLFKRSKYIDLTEKIPEGVKLQTKNKQQSCRHIEVRLDWGFGHDNFLHKFDKTLAQHIQTTQSDFLGCCS